MSHYTHVRQIYNSKNEPVFKEEKRVAVRPYLNEKWSSCFLKSINELALSRPSRFALTLFLYLIGQQAMTGNDLLIPVSDIAQEFGVSSTFIHRHIRELVDLDVLIESKLAGKQKCYRFNPRIIWHGSVDKRPIDLLPYPEIASRRKLFKPKEKTQQ